MSVSVRGWRLRRWQAASACLMGGVATLGLVSWGVLGSWQGLSENRGSVTASSAAGVPVTSVHCSGLSPAYPASCNDTSGKVMLSWSAVAGSPGITVTRATSPAGPYSIIATLAGTATTYSDASAGYNAQYYYEVYSGAAGWVSAADVDMALSLPPTGGTDATVRNPATLTAANLAAMAVADGSTYTTAARWGGFRGTAINATIDAVDCISASRCWVAGQGGALWTTADGGQSWTRQNLPGGGGPFRRGVNLAGVDFADASDGWVVGQSGAIYATTDGGTTWTAQSSGLTGRGAPNLTGVACVSATQCWVAGGGGTILATTDGGAAWTAQTSGTGQYLTGIFCVSTTQCWAVGDGGTILATTDGGATWTAQTSGTGQNLTAVSCVSGTQCWTVGDGGTVLATADGGATWTDQASGTTQNLLSVSMVSTTTGWAVGAGGTILDTTDGGATWTAQTSGTTQSVNAISASDPADAVAGITVARRGGTGGVLVTGDGGATWGVPSNQYVEWTFSPVVASGAPVTRAVVTLVDSASRTPAGTATTALLVSVDGGSTWTSFPIANPATALATQVVNISSAVSTGAAVSGLELRYVVSGGSYFTSTFDLVHVDIN